MLEMKQLAQCTKRLALVVQMIWTILTCLRFFWVILLGGSEGISFTLFNVF